MDLRTSAVGIDLSGSWQFAFTDQAVDRRYRGPAELQGLGLKLMPAAVPGNLELDLQANGLLDEPFYAMNILQAQKYEKSHVWYARRFDVPADRLNHDGPALLRLWVDCFADVYLNGLLVGSCDNMLVEHGFDLAGKLQPSNELAIHIRPAAMEAAKYEYPASVGAMGRHAESLYVRKAPHMYGWDIMPRALSAGLWRPAKILFLPRERIDEVYVHTGKLMDGNRSCRMRMAFRTTACNAPGDSYEMQIEGACGDSKVSVRRPIYFGAGQIWWDVQDVRLWWPRGYGSANLYDVKVSLIKNGRVLDTVSFTHGVRTVELVRTSVTSPEGTGEFVFKVNGVKVFCKGSNHVPADAFHSRDASRLPKIVEMAADLECNILRAWGGNVYEDDLFYDLCDRAGIMVWQDFAMACAVYPQDAAFQNRLADEATKAVKRLRQHASIVLWAGDNECDLAHMWNHLGDPNRNVLTRKVLPEVVRVHDPARQFLPSSPYVDAVAFAAGEESIPEHHLWGPRDYFKSEFYRTAICHFVSEIGYHGCPNVDSMRKFLSPERVWPWQDNPEWVLHSTNPTMGTDVIGTPDARVMLMVNQVRSFFGKDSQTLEEFVFASQASQAEAKKFFIERFRGGKWRRTGVIWWNLIDGWPQFSDAVVDYYFGRKLAYQFIKASQQHVCLMLSEPQSGVRKLLAVNDTLADVPLEFAVSDIDGREVASGSGLAAANQSVPLAEIPESREPKFYVIRWKTPAGTFANHHTAVPTPPIDLAQYRDWLRRSGLYAT